MEKDRKRTKMRKRMKSSRKCPFLCPLSESGKPRKAAALLPCSYGKRKDKEMGRIPFVEERVCFGQENVNFCPLQKAQICSKKEEVKKNYSAHTVMSWLDL